MDWTTAIKAHSCRSISTRCDETFQFAQCLQTQFQRTEALRLLKLGGRAEYHAQRDFRRSVLILERGPGVGMFRPVLAPLQYIAAALRMSDLRNVLFENQVKTRRVAFIG